MTARYRYWLGRLRDARTDRERDVAREGLVFRDRLFERACEIHVDRATGQIVASMLVNDLQISDARRLAEWLADMTEGD